MKKPVLPATAVWQKRMGRTRIFGYRYRWIVNSNDVFEEEIKRHVLIAMEEADVILFLVDVPGAA